MRVVAAYTGATLEKSRPHVSRRAANVEMLGLAASSVVILLGLCLTYGARAGQATPGASVNLQRLQSPNDIAPLLTMFDQPFERQASAAALYGRAADRERPLQHVGGLAEVTIPAADIAGERRFAVLRSRLERRPAAERVAVLTPPDIETIKGRLVVRTAVEYRSRVLAAAACLFGAFWAAHLVRRVRRADDDPVLLPILLLLCGIGLMSMIALRDPLRDRITAIPFAAGVVAGVAILLAASEINFEASRLRRAVLAPLAAALALAAMLLMFGTGPGSSGVKVNLLGAQPVEAIRLLVVFALAAYFARRLEFLREFSEPPTPDRPWLRYVRVPRWKDVRPVLVSMSLVLLFFFLQKDLGPALVLSCVFLALYGIARGRAAFVVAGFAMLVAGFAAAYWIGAPATVRQRVMIWVNPWDNGVPGGNQIAHGLWALSTGALWGSGPGLGSPEAIPAGYTDFVLAAIGEELGFVGLAAVVGLYALLCWRSLRIAARAPGDYTSFLATGVALALLVQALVIGSGLLGLVPLSGVVTPFLSYGRSSMLANFFAVGTLLAIARRRGPVRLHMSGPIRTLGAVLAGVTAAVILRGAWIQIVRADALAAEPSLSEQADGGYRFEYNPRLLAAARLIVRGTIYDRNGIPLATSRRAEIETLPKRYADAGIARTEDCGADAGRCYPLGGMAFHVVGDWNHQTNWAADNSSYLERDRDSKLKGYDDRKAAVEIVNPRTGERQRTVKRSYAELLPLARSRYRGYSPATRTLLARDRDVHVSIDARLQARLASMLRARIDAAGSSRGAAVVLDVETGDVLASASYPWPDGDDLASALPVSGGSEAAERMLDRARYALYPPGSTFKLVVAGAALRSGAVDPAATFACVRLPGGRVGNYVAGWSRPVRDDPLDTVPHGAVGLRDGLVMSCNAYFAQLAMHLGPKPLLDAASLFQIDVARDRSAAALRSTLPHAGYGQGEVLVSPLKMARVAAAVANRGLVLPAAWGGEAKPGASQRFLSTADAGLLAQFMRQAVTSGTGRVLRSNPTPIAGKTGTAEVQDGKAHSWFAGFAPYGGPGRKIAFAVVVENAGYGGRTAAPIAGDLVTAAREIGWFR